MVQTILTGGKTNLKVVEIYDHKSRTLSYLEKKYGNRADFSQIMEYFTNDKLFAKYKEILYAASPIETKIRQAFSEQKPLCDLADKNGIITIEKTYNGITGRMTGLSLDAAAKAGFNIAAPGAVIVAKGGYSTREDQMDGDSVVEYTTTIEISTPKGFEELMRVLFSPDTPYQSGQMREVEAWSGLPLGKLSISGPNSDNLYLYIRRPGSAVPGDCGSFGVNLRFGALLGGNYYGNGRFGGATPENTGAQAPAAKILAPTPAQFEAALQEAKELGVSESALDVILAYATKQ